MNLSECNLRAFTRNCCVATLSSHLLNKHIFVVFEKENELDEVDFRFESVVKPFGKIM